KMHIRVLLSKYRAYTPCQNCGGARLKPESLWWRVGSFEAAEQALSRPGEEKSGRQRFRPVGTTLATKKFNQLPGLNIHDVMCLPLARCAEFFKTLGGNSSKSAFDEATQLLL